jgi:hypothetical protein
MAVNSEWFLAEHTNTFSGLLGTVAEAGSITSYQEYLLDMLRPYTWGDEMILLVVSLMFGLRISIVLGETLVHRRIRHTGDLDDADLVVVYVGNCHYLPAGNHCFIYWFFTRVEGVFRTDSEVSQAGYWTFHGKLYIFIYGRTGKFSVRVISFSYGRSRFLTRTVSF